MMQSRITVEHLRKVYRIPVRKQGLSASFMSLIKPVYDDVVAVDDISFMVHEGETVGLIGPNGAGKTTMLKMLSGLLHPTSGRIDVAGFIPAERKEAYLKSISMIMGNKSQLTWDITVADSLHIVKEIYQVESRDFEQRLNELVNLLEMEALLPKLARNLSLGERAKCEFAAALIYKPDILFLDEPTLGMDVSIQQKIRHFIREYRRKNNTTIILTSHYMADITSLCERVILINNGNMVYDGHLKALADRLMPFRLIKLTADTESGGNHEDMITGLLSDDVALLNHDAPNYTLRVRKNIISRVSLAVLNSIPLKDFTIEDPPVEDVIDQVYRKGLSE